MSNQFHEFRVRNEIRIGEGKDFTVTPPLYYQSLNDAFYNWFCTFRNNKDRYHFLVDPNEWNLKSIGFSFNNSDSTVFTILSFHRFFELLIKDVLARIDPQLAVKFPNKPKETLSYINGVLPISKMQSLEFNSAFGRLKEAINFFDESDLSNYAIADKFRFLIADDTLQELTFWRNRVMHNGTTLPNIFLMDYLVTQRIIPLVNKVIAQDFSLLKNRLPHFFETLSGLNVINELEKIRFDFRDFDQNTLDNEIGLKLLKIGHLKEIGRANFLLDPLIAYDSCYYNNYYSNPTERNHRIALLEQNHEHFQSINECPCCGFETLVVYRKEFKDIFTQQNDFISWTNCTTCSYNIKNNIGDPFYFQLSYQRFFSDD